MDRFVVPGKRLFTAAQRTRSARVRSLLAVVGALLMTTIGWASSPAHAADDQLQVTTATGDAIVPGQPILLRVSASAETLTTGTIVVSSGATTAATVAVPAVNSINDPSGPPHKPATRIGGDTPARE